MAILRAATFYEECSCFIFDDGSVSSHDVEISPPSRLSGGASRCRSSVPNVLSSGDLAWPSAILHSCAEGHLNRKGPRNRWCPRVGALCHRSRSSDYFGASEPTISSKRGSPRSGSQ